MRRGYGDYPLEWTKFANQLKESVGWVCQRCGVHHGPPPNVLTIHHLTMNKAEDFSHWWAFLPCCQVCHLSIQAKVVMERIWYLPHSEWFRPYVAGYVAHAILGIDLDRETATKHADLLIGVHQGTVEVEEAKRIILGGNSDN